MNMQAFRGNSCPFCERVRRGDYEHSWSFGPGGPHVVAFAPLNPVTVGHMLVVPAAHIPDVSADPRLAGFAMHAAANLARRLCGDGTFHPFNIITSAGAAATQTVFHAHLHVVPRREGDGLKLPWTP